MPHTAELEFGCPSAAVAKAVRDALAVEAEGGPEGSRMQVAASGSSLSVRLEGPDLATLRAAVHSAVRLAEAAIRAASVGGPQPGGARQAS